MIDIGALVLNKILTVKDLTAWSRIKPQFFDKSYASIVTGISAYYNQYGEVPSFSELLVHNNRNNSLINSISTLENLEIPEETDIDVAIDALTDSYTQNEAFNLLDKFIDNVTTMNSEEIKDSLSNLVMQLDEKTHTSENIVTMDSILLFDNEVNSDFIRFPSGFSNTLDSKLGGLFREETVLIGGKRGAGKSIVCANAVTSQYELGNPSVYFTIEMSGRETLLRMMSILAEIPHAALKQDSLSPEEMLRLIKTRASMFIDSDDLVLEYIRTKDKVKFELELIKTKQLNPDNQIIIIDDRELSLASIDLHLQKLKSKFGDKLKLAVIDYLNQIVVPGLKGGMYDWTTQIFVSKKLKELARKYQICIISPYQIDDSGGTRFAKGILDSCDIAFLLDAHSKEDSVISFDTTKIRGGPPIEFSNSINWETLRINPAEVQKPSSKKEKKEKKEDTEPKEKGDLPW